MRFILLATAFVAAIPAALADLTINSPVNVVSCEPTLLSWANGQSPYYLSIAPAGQPSATPLVNLGTQQGTSYSWNVNLAQGVSFTIVLKDSTGSTAYSSIITVNGGGPSCNTTTTGGSGSSSGSSASGGSSSPSSGAASTPGSSAGAGSSATAGSGSATNSASGSTATQRSAAGRVSASSALGVAGVMGLVGAMLF